MKLRIVVKRPYGDVEVEGDSLDEVVEGLRALPDWVAVIDNLVTSVELPTRAKVHLGGLVELTEKGPIVTVSKEKISEKDAIGLLLYASAAKALKPRTIARLLEMSGRPSKGYGARLSEMRREGLTVKDADGYLLSAMGRKRVEELVSALGGEQRFGG